MGVKTALMELGMAEGDFDTHESDLYVKKTPISEKYLETYDHKDSVKEFKNEREPNVGQTWYDFPFANDEWWESKKKTNASIETISYDLLKSGKDMKEVERILAEDYAMPTDAKKDKVSNKALLTFYKVDEDTGNKYYKNQYGRLFCTVEDVMHICTEEGEPLHPITNYEILPNTKVKSSKEVKADGKEDSMFPWGDYGDDEKFEEYWSEKHRGEVSDDFAEYFYAGDYKKAYEDLVRQMSDSEFKEAMEFIIRMNS
jgi:hypothetical protein